MEKSDATDYLGTLNKMIASKYNIQIMYYKFSILYKYIFLFFIFDFLLF